jgi:hypothetical protein
MHGLKSSVKQAVAYSTKRREASQVKASQKLKTDPRLAPSQPTYNTIPCTRKYKRFWLDFIYLSDAGKWPWCPDHGDKI